MDINNIFRNRLTGKTVDLLSHALDYRSANHNVISGNIANIDTPGYQPKELSFDQTLKAEVCRSEGPLKRTDPKHFSHYTGGLSGDKVTFSLRNKVAATGETNQLNIDREMAEMVKNNLLYDASAKLLSKKLESLRSVIEGGK